MSHFYTESRGAGQTAATRCGHKTTGASSYTRGYKNGGKVEVWHSEGQDFVRLDLCEGSGSYGSIHVPRAVIVAKQVDKDDAATEIVTVDIEGYICVPHDGHLGPITEKQAQAIKNAIRMIVAAG